VTKSKSEYLITDHSRF